MPFFVVLILIIAGCVGLDQLTKIIVCNTLEIGENVPLIEGVFEFIHIKNDGMAFGLLGEHRWVFITISVVGILALCLYLFRFSTDSRLTKIGMALIIGGGIGNMIDRSLPPYLVTDMLQMTFLGDLFPWVFNVADSFVCVGVGIVILGLVLDIIKEYKEKKQATEQPEEIEQVKEEAPNDSDCE